MTTDFSNKLWPIIPYFAFSVGESLKGPISINKHKEWVSCYEREINDLISILESLERPTYVFLYQGTSEMVLRIIKCVVARKNPLPSSIHFVLNFNGIYMSELIGEHCVQNLRLSEDIVAQHEWLAKNYSIHLVSDTEQAIDYMKLRTGVALPRFPCLVYRLLPSKNYLKRTRNYIKL